MADADYYRQQSEFCARMADVVQEPTDKRRWLKLAHQWRELAEQVERAPVSGIPGLV
jgi:hypothetical protein